MVGAEEGMEAVDHLCSRNARSYLQNEVKAEAEVEQRSIRAVASFPSQPRP